MRFRDFEQHAWRLWEKIPAEYKEGIDRLVVERGAKPHPGLPDIYTLGECLTEAYPSDFGGPDTIRSAVVLYWGSFQALSRLDDAFDWEAEMWETLTHELRHHLESLATEDALEEIDYAADENFKRLEGEPFDPFFYRYGEPLSAQLWAVEEELFLEVGHEDAAPSRGALEFEWEGRLYTVPAPERLGDVCFLWIEDGIDVGDGELTLVLVRRRGLGKSLRSFLRGEALEVVEAEGVAESAQPS